MEYGQGAELAVVLIDPGEGVTFEVAPSFEAFRTSLFVEMDGTETVAVDYLDIRLLGIGGVRIVP